MSHATDMTDDLWDEMLDPTPEFERRSWGRVPDDTAEALRERAAASEAERAASWERSDTDGFLSQWAHGITADRDRAQADLTEAGGQHQFLALFTLAGEHVPARRVESKQYGWPPRWQVLTADGRGTGTFLPYLPKRRTTLTSKGYTEGYVMRPAAAVITGSGRGMSGAASCRVTIQPTDEPHDQPTSIITTDRWLSEVQS